MRSLLALLRVAAVLLLVFALTTFALTLMERGAAREEAATRGLSWLSASDGDYGDPVAYWVVFDIASRYCHSSELAQEVTERFASRERTSVEKAYFAYLIGEDSGPAPLATKRYDRWMLGALACTDMPMPESLLAEITELGSGYDLTHQYAALSHLDARGCGTKETAGAREQAATKMAEEELALRDEFNDLSAERAALLLRGGHESLVGDDWINRIVRSQDTSGGWAAVRGAEPNPHTTALALWAIVQKMGQCPLVD